MKNIIKIIVPLLILGGAFFCGGKLADSKKKPKSQKPAAVIPRVDVIEVSPDVHAPPVISFGTVQSYFETTIVPQISARITDVSERFRVGQMVKKGELLATLDTIDFQSELASEQANYALQKRSLAEETILAKQAAEDWVASGRKLEGASDFVLRKPQLATAKANIISAEASVNKALADIDRARLRAPYDAVVIQRTASVGNFASAQTSLGTLVATERAEIRLALTAQQLARIERPDQDSPKAQTIILTSPNKPDYQWEASLVRTEGVIDPENQVIYVIAEIEKPYSAQKEPLAVGSFVNASIPCIPVGGIFQLPESALVNDAYVWLIDEDSKLVRSPAKRLHSAKGSVYVKIPTEGRSIPLIIVSRPLSNFITGNLVEARKVLEDK